MPGGDRAEGYVHPELLVTPAALAAELDAGETPLLVDLRPAEAFAAGSLPGAVHLDLWGVSLVDTDAAPMRAFFWIVEHLLAGRGVTGDRPIVVYESRSGVRAARAFWFLEYFGHRQVRLLDGGSDAWVKAGFRLGPPGGAPAESAWTGIRDESRVATWRDVVDRLGHPEAVLVDTRSDEEYCGAIVRARRGGAIPGAVHVEWRRNLGSDGAFKPAHELRAMYRAVGVTPDREVITYCQGGYRAAHTYLALRLLGYPRVRNYVGSWKEWGDREDLPVEKP